MENSINTTIVGVAFLANNKILCSDCYETTKYYDSIYKILRKSFYFLRNHDIITEHEKLTQLFYEEFTMKSKRVLSMILICVLVAVGVIPTYAGNTQEKLNNARAAKRAIQSSLDETKDRIERLESQKGESENYLSELSIQLEDLKNSLIQLQADEDKKQAELEKVQQELQEAKEQEEKQYEDMKLRIQFMYENSSTGYLVMLLSASDFTDFLNRADNISQISEYDRDMLKNYQEVKDLIDQKEGQVQKEKRAIEVLKEESAQKQGEVKLVRDSTSEQISVYQADIQNAESEESLLLSRINDQEDEINGLIRQAQAEEAAAQAAREAAQAAKLAAKANSSSGGLDSSSDSSESSSSSSSSDRTSEDSSSSSNDDSSEPVSTPVPTKAPEASSGGKYLGKFRLTAYCSCSRCCGQWAGGPTASGTRPSAGRTVAMGGVPFGTKLRINGNVYTVEDRGTSYGHVDIFFGSHSAALSFGSKYADVYQVN